MWYTRRSILGAALACAPGIALAQRHSTWRAWADGRWVTMPETWLRPGDLVCNLLAPGRVWLMTPGLTRDAPLTREPYGKAVLDMYYKCALGPNTSAVYIRPGKERGNWIETRVLTARTARLRDAITYGPHYDFWKRLGNLSYEAYIDVGQAVYEYPYAAKVL